MSDEEENSSLPHDYPVREPDARNSLPSSSRFSSHRLSTDDSRRIEHAVSSRVTHDDETNSLLERYGIRKTSVVEKHSQSYLKQHRHQQSDSDGGFIAVRRKSDTTAIDAMLSGDGLNLPRTLDRKDTFRQPNSGVQEITHAEYLNRLLAAHNRVDDLLRSRGLSAEDESKYLRAWEAIPIIREKVYHRVRKPSNSSDSGLSTDSDSDRSHPEGAKIEGLVCEEFSKPQLNITCVKLLPIPCCSIKTSYSCQTMSKTFSFAKKPSFKRISQIIFMRIPVNESVSRLSASPLYANVSASYVLKKEKRKKEKLLITRKVFRSPRKGECVQVSITAAHSLKSPSFVNQKQKIEHQMRRKQPPKMQGSKIQESKPVDITEQQRMVRISLQPLPKHAVPLTAEISIQHCSFYQVTHKGVKASTEKNVRINLRLTERAPNKWKTTITLPTALRSVFKEVRNGANSLQFANVPRAVGKLDWSITTDLTKDIKQQPKVNRLRIPDCLLHSDNAITEEIKRVRHHLKRVKPDALSGFFAMPKQPAQLKLLNANRQKQNPEKMKENCGFHLNFLPANAPNPLFQSAEPLSSVADETQSCLSQNEAIYTSDILNFSGSTDGAAISFKATSYESKIPELSHIDRLLIEHFIRSKHIPRPKALRQCASLYTQQLKTSTQHSTPPKVEFRRSRTPVRRPKQAHRHSSPPILRRALCSNKQLLKKQHRLDCPPLKKIDRSFQKSKVKIRSAKRWIPTHLDVDDSMTEAEKAMAASKRRQFEEQKNKLQEYDERRRIEREKEEEELKKLKEKQERRRLEREQEEREQAERRKQEEDRRRKEEEDRKAKQEEEKRRKDEEKMRRQQISGAAFTATAGQGGRNFIIPKKSENRNDKFGNIVQAKQEMGMTKEQQEEAKRFVRRLSIP
uniref:VEFS-Box domain-containing protein n=1 Tax=Angiostrongylus cantonensis TaxID=6313 RepID=A0A0K0DPD6_ANGCA